MKRSELRAWTKRTPEGAEDSEYLTMKHGLISNVLAGLPMEAAEGAVSADDRRD